MLTCFFSSQRGSLTVEGLFDLALKAARQWAADILENAEGVESLRGSFGLTEIEVRMAYETTGRGGVILVSDYSSPLERMPDQHHVAHSGRSPTSPR